MNAPQDKFKLYNDWARITVQEFRKKMTSLHIGQSWNLYNSFEQHVIAAAGGDIEKISFAYRYYGMFVDMGVGKGTHIGDVKDNSTSRRLEGKQTGNRRRGKKWYSKTIFKETSRLADLLMEYYGEAALLQVNDNLPGKIALKL